MTEDRVPNWSRCQAVPGCAGAALQSWGRCLGHLHGDDLEQAIKRANTEGLDARGVTVTPSLLERIFSLLDRTDQDGLIVPNAQFDRAIFTGPARFDKPKESKVYPFRGVTFRGDARFDEAIFRGDAWFTGATFSGNVVFSQTIFSGNVGFGQATFSRAAVFYQATFSEGAGFVDAIFSEGARFREATFSRNVVFYQATFAEVAVFDAVRLSGRLSFQRVRAAKRLWLALRDDSIGEVDLTEASFAGPAVVAVSLGGAGSPRPRLLSLVQADTTNLTVAGLDLSNCRFLGAINLERLRIDGPLLLDEPPGWWRARRRVLWEEGELRGWPSWATPDRQDGPEVAPHRGERASRLQAVYRELRKAREDANDEPGAADFYYGEMEMRRQAARGVERWLLTSYWAVSGYGLRASRAVLALVALLAGATVGLHVIGSHPQRGWRDATLYAVYTSTSLLRPTATVPLTRWGQFIEITLRLLVPVLLGLAVLAIRGHFFLIKR